MRREIKVAGRLPSYEELVIQELGRLLEQTCALSTRFSQVFTPNANQKKVFDLIEGSMVPKSRSLHILLYGPTGTGKSYAALAYAIDKLLSYPGTNALGCRRTATDIKTSIFKDAMGFLDRWNVPFTSNSQDTYIRLPNASTFWMRSDKSLVQAKKDKSDALGSTAYSLVILEEADSLSEELANTIAGRMREDTGDFRRVIFYICNPPDDDHWLYQRFFGQNNNPDDPTSRYRALKLELAGNEFIRDGYAEDMEEDYAHNPALYERMKLGNFGPAVRGIPIFKDSFNLKYHVAEESFIKTWNPNFPMVRGWDFGYRGMAMTILQDDPIRKQVRVFYSKLNKNCLFDTFADEQLVFCHRHFPGAEWVDTCDPAGCQKTGLTALTYHDIMKQKGMYPRYQTSTVEVGLNLIEDVLNSSVKGRPAILFDPVYCNVLVKAFYAGYCNEKERADVGIVPVKDGVYDHIMDAFRYSVLHIRNPRTFKSASKQHHTGFTPVDGMGTRVHLAGPRSNSFGYHSRMG